MKKLFVFPSALLFLFLTPLGSECAAATVASTSVFINSGGGKYVDPTGQTWSADEFYSGGYSAGTSAAIANTTMPTLYQSERYGTFNYNIAMPNGSYAVTLKFAEIYFYTSGARVFNVSINGTRELTNFDVFAAAGGANRAIDKTFPVTVTNGQVQIVFTSVVDYASIKAIEIEPVSAGPVSISVTPPAVSLTSHETQSFAATVAGSSNTGVTWALNPAVGSISASGVYTAPATVSSAQTVTVTATSAADSTKSATATVSLTPIVISLSPAAVSLQPSQHQTFTPSVSGSSNGAVTWSYSQNLGSYASSTTSLLYTAPSTAPSSRTVTITATSSADSTKTATAVITLPQATTVSVSPASASLSASGTQQFTAAAIGNANAAVTWSIYPPVGSISSSGLYSAPSSIATSQTVTVTAASVASPEASASATVVLEPQAYTYYVDSVNGSDSNPGTLAAPWKTIAKVNSTTLSAGQSVAFKAGGVWREQLTVFDGGSAGKPVTFTSYGSGAAPIISGADVLTSWTTSPPYYTNAVSVAPTQLFRNGVRLTQVSTEDALVTGTWWLNPESYRIHVYDNPNGSTIEASERTYGVEIGASYVTVNGLTIEEAAKEGVGIFTGSNYVTVTNCAISNSYSNGIAVWSASNSITNGLLQGNTISGSGGNGIDIEQNATDWTIQYNTVYGNSTNPAVNAYSAGIDMGSSSVSNITIQYNTVYSNGLGQLTNIGFGIHVDIQSPNNVIRWNTVSGNNDCNILVEISEHNQIYGNVVYGSIQGCGIGLRGAAGTPASGNVVSNNTIYGNLATQIWAGGLLAFGDGNAGSFVNNTFENNVSVGNGSRELNAFGGAENDGANGYGNVYSHNDFGPDALNVIHWGSSVFYSSLAAWQGASKQSENLNVTPLFTNPAGGDFSLQSGSPLIGAGVYVPGVSAANPPNIGAM